MALSNFIVTVAGVSAVVLLLGTDLKKSIPKIRHNVGQIRNWLKEESASAAKKMEKAKPKEISGKDVPKKDKD
ncbi:hypothetical protein ACS0TY_000456 [Phlomoides rotata]